MAKNNDGVRKSGMLNWMKSVFSDLTGRNKFDKMDFALLKTTLMLAAVDGEVGEDEVAKFNDFAEKCRGYNGEAFDGLWDSALRSAGYLMLQSRFLGRDELAEVFVKEAERDFVGEVVLGISAERKLAFDFLERMASADGEFSEVERACITALAEKVKAVRERMLAERYPHATAFDR